MKFIPEPTEVVLEFSFGGSAIFEYPNLDILAKSAQIWVMKNGTWCPNANPPKIMYFTLKSKFYQFWMGPGKNFIFWAIFGPILEGNKLAKLGDAIASHPKLSLTDPLTGRGNC